MIKSNIVVTSAQTGHRVRRYPSYLGRDVFKLWCVGCACVGYGVFLYYKDLIPSPERSPRASAL